MVERADERHRYISKHHKSAGRNSPSDKMEIVANFLGAVWLILAAASSASGEKNVSATSTAVERVPSALSKKDQPRILIIGAGMAGLSAAQRLEELGLDNYAILEATDRIGGRIKTVKFGDGHADLGADNILGMVNNSLYDYARKRNLIDMDLYDYWKNDYVESEYRLQNGKVWPNTKLAADHWFALIVAVYKAIRSERPSARSVGALIDEVADATPINVTLPDEAYFRRQMARWYKRSLSAHHACYSTSEMSPQSMSHYRQDYYNGQFALINGASTLIESIRSELRKAAPVHLESPVDTVRLLTPSTNGEDKVYMTERLNIDDPSDKPLVVVTLENGTRHVADHVIVTVSLGVLKHGLTRSMFQPRLPEAKVQAIENMGYGTADPIFVLFDRPFWPTANFSGYFLIPEVHHDNRDISTDWWRDLVRFLVWDQSSNTLIGLSVSHEAEFMELTDERVVQEKCLQMMQKSCAVENMPKVLSFARATWHSDKYMRGSMSYMTRKAPTPEVSTLLIGQPIYAAGDATYPAILFAGEATHPHYYRTMHGARDTGIQEAERIADYYKGALK